MCSSKTKQAMGVKTMTASAPTSTTSNTMEARIKGRAVLQPTCNGVPCSLERRNNNSVNKIVKSPRSPPSSASALTNSTSKSQKPPSFKRAKDINGLNSSMEIMGPAGTTTSTSTSNISRAKAAFERNKSKSFRLAAAGSNCNDDDQLISPLVEVEANFSLSLRNYSSNSYLITESPGSIADIRREHMAIQQSQRKMRIAHYGRSKSARFEKVVPFDFLSTPNNTTAQVVKRCSFITPNSDPLYVAYHDQEWGVPVHDDKMLFELLVLSVAQVGSDWTSILKKRQDFRDAFSGFDAEVVAKFSESQMMSISSKYGIDISRVRGVVDNSNRILEIKKEFGTLDKYLWAFVNEKPISNQYKAGNKIPVKTSKSESISKDMVRRGFRNVGPIVVYSFMQAAGLTNDHTLTCHRQLQCTLLANC